MSSPAPSPPAQATPRTQARPAWPGHHAPLGASWDGAGTNFALYGEHAERVVLVLFEPDGAISDEYELTEKTDHTFHGYVECSPGQHYGYRVWGQYDPVRGLRYNPTKLLLDPYAKAVTGAVRWGPEVYGYDLGGRDDLVASTVDSSAAMPRGIVVDPSFGWIGDRRPNISWADTVIYETHVRGFTMNHPGIPQRFRGT
ncbi:MAG: glycogen debranching enzyme GlgX, partial [Candidatus Dormibacteria bacterium]